MDEVGGCFFTSLYYMLNCRNIVEPAPFLFRFTLIHLGHGGCVDDHVRLVGGDDMIYRFALCYIKFIKAAARQWIIQGAPGSSDHVYFRIVVEQHSQFLTK